MSSLRAYGKTYMNKLCNILHAYIQTDTAVQSRLDLDYTNNRGMTRITLENLLLSKLVRINSHISLLC